MQTSPYWPATRIFDSERRLCIQSPELILGEVDWGQCIHVGAGTSIQAEGGLRVGNFVVISYDCVIWSINHDYRELVLPYGTRRIKRPIVIEDYVWIGRNAIINGGLRIGEGAIIGMGAVITCDVPALAIVAGNPARLLGFRPVGTYLEARRMGETLWTANKCCGACENPAFYTDERIVSKNARWSLPLRLVPPSWLGKFIERRLRSS